MEESLKQKKHDIDNVECLGMKLHGTNKVTVDDLNSKWAALQSKVK